MSTDTNTDQPTETTDPATVLDPDTAEQTADSTSEPAPDWQAEVEKWKAMARKHEKTAKANAEAAKALEELKLTQMSDQERAVTEAADKARTEVRQEYAAKLVDAQVRAASVTSGVDVDTLLEGLDRSRFITDDGEVDTAKVTEWVAKVAPPKTAERLDLGQGVRGKPGTAKVTVDQLKTMTPQEIVDARKAGRIDFATR